MAVERPRGQDKRPLGSNGAPHLTPESSAALDPRYVHFTLLELQEADRLTVGPEIIAGRPIVSGIAVDPPGALDKDDAFDVKRDGRGYVVDITIADPNALIPPGTLLDSTAARKYFTRYFENGKDPMLPEVISDEKLSLHPGEPKPGFTLSVPFGSRLQIGEPTIQRTAFIGRDGLTYQEADEMMRSAFFPEFEVLDAAFRIASHLARSRGTQYDLSAFTEITEEGQVAPIKWGEANLSMISVREFMILSNRLMARFAMKEGIPIPFRSHDSMDSRSYYGATFRGHIGLGFGIDNPYTHGTSPLRRGADKKTQEQILAVIEGREPTYTHEEIEQASREINIANNRYRDGNGRSLYAKALIDAQVRQALAQGDFSRLDALPIRRVMKVGTREGHLDSLGSWLMNRLSTGRNGIVGASIAPFVFNSETSGIVEEVLDTLVREHPAIVRESLEHIARERGYPIRYNSGKESSVVYLGVGGVDYESDPAKDPHRGIARDHAAAQLVVNLRRKGVFNGSAE